MNSEQIQTNRFLIEHKRLLMLHLNKCAMEMNPLAYEEIHSQIKADIELIDKLINYHSCSALPQQGGASSLNDDLPPCFEHGYKD